VIRALRLLRDLAAMLPRLVRMVRALIADPHVPGPAKVALVALAVYLVSPLDLLPDFIPVLGLADDVLLAAVVLDGVLSFVDRSVVLRYWPGSPASLETTAAVASRLARWVPARVKARIFSGR
jgi:uncharacterized membrane protein YkvA (DUF1232 family)